MHSIISIFLFLFSMYLWYCAGMLKGQRDILNQIESSLAKSVEPHEAVMKSIVLLILISNIKPSQPWIIRVISNFISNRNNKKTKKEIKELEGMWK